MKQQGYIISFVLCTVFAVACCITQVSFIKSDCVGELKGSNLSCVNLSAIFFVSTASEKVDMTITSYDNGEGTVKLKSPLRIQIEVKNMTVQYGFARKEVVYNNYELFEPGEGCAIASSSSQCTEKTTAPADSQGYILCCIDRAIRGTGGFCLRTDYAQKYEAYTPMSPSFLNQVVITVTHRGKTLIFEVDSYINIVNIAYEGRASMSANLVEGDARLFGKVFKNQLMFFRDARDASSSMTDLSKWFLVDDYEQFRIFMTESKYASLSKCYEPRGITAPHAIADHLDDQFYTARENTPKRYLSEHGASYPDSGVVMVSSDPATADSIRFLAPSPLLDISLVVYNIIIDD